MKVPAVLLTCIALVFAGCGKEGPPLPPLNLVPAPASDVTVRRVAQQVELRFVLPTRNQNGPGAVDLGRIEIFAITAAPGSTPANRVLFSKERLVGTIDVKPVPEEGERPPDNPADKRPSPGDRVTFTEQLTPPTLTVVLDPAPEKTKAEANVPDAAPQGPPQRVYAIRGVTRGGRPGPPAPRIAVPLAAPPAAPSAVDIAVTERAFIVSWLPPVLETPAATGAGTPASDPVAFNVYASADAGAPLNASPLTDPRFEYGPVRFDVEQCFVVRATKTVQNIRIESEPSESTCETPRDVFPPAAPKGLQVVAGPDGVSLSWDANTEADLAGYVVLRGDAPDETLHALTPPIRETNYRDTTAQSGASYVYRLVAVDTAKNTSTQSEPARVTAR